MLGERCQVPSSHAVAIPPPALTHLVNRFQVLAHKLDAAEVERSKTAAAAASVVSLRDGMHALVGTLCAKASVLAVRHPTPSRQLLEGQDTAG